ncbi:F-box only protein 47-like [Tubulanus polymorphus]|uniref:F-box only protein 47-like n=1 Tax=Tubulanus polymorphus TaxID=672921 RepID=UPI003DA26B8C
MSFGELFHCKKLRRSARLEIKGMNEIKNRHIEQAGDLGSFTVLPLELKFITFSFLSIEELSILALTSKQMRNIVEVYRCSKSSNQIQPPVTIHDILLSHETAFIGLQHFQQLGLLVKRTTCLYATKERLKIIERIMMQHMCLYSKSCVNASMCFSLVYFGKLLNTIIAGWDDAECNRTLITLSNSPFSNMWKCLQLIVNSKPGTHSELESHVRYFFRRVFLDPANKLEERGLWLRKILEGWPMVHQARILYILYGPLVGGLIQWNDLSENTIANRNQLFVYFSELGSALQLLTNYWSDDDVISVLDELTNLPEEWLAENISALLFITGNSISMKYLGSKAINGRIQDISALITSSCLVHVKADRSLSNVITLIQQLCKVIENPAEKTRFLNEVVLSFKEILLDIYEFDDSDDDRFTDMSHIVDAQTQFMTEIIHLAFKH